MAKDGGVPRTAAVASSLAAAGSQPGTQLNIEVGARLYDFWLSLLLKLLFLLKNSVLIHNHILPFVRVALTGSTGL